MFNTFFTIFIPIFPNNKTDTTMKKILLFLLLISGTLFPQDFKFAWLTDIHIGYPGADAGLDSVVTLVNNLPDIDFVVITGDIAEKGRNDELQIAYDIIQKLEKPFYIIPGNHDTKWSESGLTKFSDLWGDNKFNFDFNGSKFIGVNSGIPWRGGGGHVAPEDLEWLDKQLSDENNYKHLFFFIHHPLDETIDNWYKVTNILRKHNISIVMCGHTHTSKMLEFNGIPSVMSRSTLAKGKPSWGCSIVEAKNDTVSFFEIDSVRTPEQYGTIVLTDSFSVPEIDSADVIDYNAEILWQKDLNTTLSATPLLYGDKIYTADYSGIISCFDSTGTLLWDYDSFGNLMSKPAISDGILVAATAQGDMLTLDAETGIPLQTIGFDTPVSSQLITINYTGKKSFMLPKPNNLTSAVVFGTSDGKLYCYDLETLENIWVNESATGMIETRPLLLDDRIYYGAWDGNFYCVDANTGLLIWKWRDGGNFYYSPAASVPVTNGENIFFTTPEKKVYAVDKLLGTTQWVTNDYRAWESIGISQKQNRLFVKSMQDKFHIISSASGNPVKNIDFGFGLDTMPIEIYENNNKIVFGAKNGEIFEVNNADFSSRKLLFAGTSRLHTVQIVSDGVYLASNMDGKIIMFRVKND